MAAWSRRAAPALGRILRLFRAGRAAGEIGAPSAPSAYRFPSPERGYGALVACLDRTYVVRRNAGDAWCHAALTRCRDEACLANQARRRVGPEGRSNWG